MPNAARNVAKPTGGADLAYVNGKVLTWAITRAQLSRPQIASKVKVNEGRIAEWEKGQPIPFDKARALAALLRFPFGYFFLHTPPVDELPIPDRRQLGPKYKPTPDFLQLVNDVLLRRDWYEDFLKAHGRPTKRPFVGSFDWKSARHGDVAASIRKTIGVTPELRNTISGWSEYLSALARNAEDAGILVMRSSVVGNSTNRPISTEEVQGFAVADQLAPVVFVNSADFKAAQVFTFAHELAHIWIGQSAVNNAVEEVSPSTDAIEAFCNQVATEVLVPASEFNSTWDAIRPERRVDSVPRRFWVSSFVVLRRAHELGRITTKEFHDLWAAEKEKIQKAKAAGGGDFYRTLFVRMGNKLTHSVVREVASNNLLIRDAARLLNVSPKTLSKVVEVAR